MPSVQSSIPGPSTSPPPVTWDVFEQLSPSDKGAYLLGPESHLKACIYSQQFNRPLLDHLFAVAELVRQAGPDSSLAAYLQTVLAGRSAVLYFTQPSTRTFTSFSLAAQATGIACEEIRDAEMSSLYKGESEIDTLLTLAELSDVIIMRQGDHSLIDRFAWEVHHRGYPTRIINGGSGPEQHPTQALLELYTLAAHFNLAEDDGSAFTVGIVGDLARSRTARSLSYLLALYPSINQVFIAPDELQIGPDLIEYLDEHGIQHSETESLDDALPSLDACYMMRIQDEYGTTSAELRKKYDAYKLDTDRLALMKDDACILHPLPRRSELPIEIDHDPRALYWEAVNRGKYVRIALLLHMFLRDDISLLAAGEY